MPTLLAAALMLLITALPASAQIAPPRTLEELKTEIQERADRKAYPVAALDAAEVREALANLKSQDRDQWAAAWVPIGDRHMAKAKALEKTNKAAAAKSYEKAMEWYAFARFPLENSVGTEAAYVKMREAFAGYGRLQVPPIEPIKINYQGRDVVAYLRVPKGVRPAPVVITIGGLDGRKENSAIRNAAYLAHGIAFLAFDMPGTGENKIKIEPGAENVFSAALDWIATRRDLDAKRVAVYGGSWGGHWSARLAYTERQRIKGAVVQGGPVHGYFQPDWQKKALGTREYLFGLFEARAAVYGVKTLDEFLAYGPRMSLVDAGFIDKPSAPMLVMNGARDSQVPVEDVYALLKGGSAKDVWLNPQGGHMGRNREVSDEHIFQTVTLPWIVRLLVASNGRRVAAVGVH